MGRNQSCKKKNLKSIDFLRQKVRSKNLKYNFLRLDKEKNIQIFEKAGWHFNNLMSPKNISLKLKSFAHSEFSSPTFSNIDVIENKITNQTDLFGRGHKYIKVNFDKSFPTYITNNKNLYNDWIL